MGNSNLNTCTPRPFGPGPQLKVLSSPGSAVSRQGSWQGFRDGTPTRPLPPLPQMRSLTGRRTDLSRLAKPVKVPTGAAAGELAGWPHAKLQVGRFGGRGGGGGGRATFGNCGGEHTEARAASLVPGAVDVHLPQALACCLQVVAEHGSLVTELLGDPRVAPLFTSPQHADKLRYFRALTVSDQVRGGGSKY